MKKLVTLAIVLCLTVGAWLWSAPPIVPPSVHTRAEDYLILRGGIVDSTDFFFPSLDINTPWEVPGRQPNVQGSWSLVWGTDEMDSTGAASDNLSIWWVPLDVLSLTGVFGDAHILRCPTADCSVFVWLQHDWEDLIDSVEYIHRGVTLRRLDWVVDDAYRWPNCAECCCNFGPYDGVRVYWLYDQVSSGDSMGVAPFMQIQ